LSNDKIIKLDNVTKYYGDTLAIEDISFSVSPGEILVLLGQSGCGKTTTLRLIAGLERPDSGVISIQNRIVSGNNNWVPPERRRIGMVFQDYALFPHLTIHQNIAFGLNQLKREQRNKRVKEMLELIELPDKADTYPHELSGGQQQRIALARALAPNPDIILLDEPFSNLDTALRAQVRGHVRDILHETKTTAIFVTHDQEEALSLSNEVAVIHRGELMQVASPQAIYNRPVNKHVAQFIGEANFVPAHAKGMIANSPLGNVKLFHETAGNVELLIRPEALRINLNDKGTPAVILWREFFGHAQRLGLQLDDGTKLTALTGVDRYYQRGQNVRVSIGLPAVAFDAN